MNRSLIGLLGAGAIFGATGLADAGVIDVYNYGSDASAMPSLTLENGLSYTDSYGSGDHLNNTSGENLDVYSISSDGVKLDRDARSNPSWEFKLAVYEPLSGVNKLKFEIINLEGLSTPLVAYDVADPSTKYEINGENSTMVILDSLAGKSGEYATWRIEEVAVPEPSTVSLGLAGLVGAGAMGLASRRNRKKALRAENRKAKR